MTPQSTWQPRLLAFVCNWAYYTPSEQAALERALANGSDRLVRVPCSGRISPFLLLNAVQEGFDAILVVGCEREACHYREGSRLAQRRLETLRQFLVYLGMEPGRVQLFWKSAIPSRPFGDLVAEVRAAARELGPATHLVRAERS